MIKELRVWKLAQEVIDTYGEMVDHLHLIESEEFGIEFRIKIYHADGYCFELEKQVHCEPEEIEDYCDIHALQPGGCTYHFSEPWDGFKTAGIDKAIEELSVFAQLEFELE
jgi:hypothetical protein